MFREEHGRAVATVIRVLGDVELAEEAVADAFTVAVERWEVDGLPPNPGGWIVTTAKRRAIDRMRRESSRDARYAQALLLHARDAPEEVGPVHDDRLRLLFTCCHPALALEARVALTLRLLGGSGCSRRCCSSRRGDPPAWTRAADPPRPGRAGGQGVRPGARAVGNAVERAHLERRRADALR